MKKAIVFILLLTCVTYANTNELKFGVYTSDKPSVMYKKFKPIIDYLENDLKNKGINLSIKLKIYPTYDKAIKGLVKGEYDFARFGPSSYILSKKQNKNIRLLVMETNKGKKKFKGVFIIKKDSNLNELSQLENKSFAFGSNRSTIGRYLSQAELLKNEISSKELGSFEYLGRHDKVALAVLNGKFDAGVVKEKTFKKFKDRGLKSLNTFDNITKPWVVKENFNEDIYIALKQSLIDLKDKKVLKIFKGDGFVETSDKEYNFVREGMNLSKRF